MSSVPFDQNKVVPVLRKGQVLKNVTAAEISKAVEESEEASEWTNEEGKVSKVEDFVLLHDEHGQALRDENGNQLALPTKRNCYWIFAIDKDGEVADSSMASEHSESFMGLSIQFFESLGFTTEVWYVGREIGIRRLS